jgi:hypothetical protein
MPESLHGPCNATPLDRETLLERHFAPGLHEEILEAVGLELGTPVATRRRAGCFRAAVLEAHSPGAASAASPCAWRTA